MKMDTSSNQNIMVNVKDKTVTLHCFRLQRSGFNSGLFQVKVFNVIP